MNNPLIDLQKQTICGICQVPLSRVTTPDSVRWVHPLRFGPPPDHEPFPVVVSDSGPAIGSCDWCGRPNPAFLVPVATFPWGLLVDDDGHTTMHYSEGAWATCDGCLPFVESRQPMATIARFVSHARTLGVDPDPLGVTMAEMHHTQAMANIEGDAVRIPGR